MATNSLWAELDDYLKASALMDMGPGSAYTTLQLRKVLVTDLRHVTRAEITDHSPLLTIDSDQVDISSGAHGDGLIHLENEYSYILSVICTRPSEGDLRDARELVREDAQELLYRMITMVRSRLRSLGTPVDTIMEHFASFRMTDAALAIRGPVAGQYEAAASLRLVVRTTV